MIGYYTARFGDIIVLVVEEQDPTCSRLNYFSFLFFLKYLYNLYLNVNIFLLYIKNHI